MEDINETMGVAETMEVAEATQKQEAMEKSQEIVRLAYDNLPLFTCLLQKIYDTLKAQEQEKQEDVSLENFFNDNTENVMRKIKDGYPDVYNAIKDDVIENLDKDDLDEEFKDDIAQEYIRDNAEEMARDCFSSMGSYAQRDFIKDCIDDL